MSTALLRGILLAFTLVTLAVSGCGRPAPDTRDKSDNRPEDVFNTFQEAVKKQDWKTAYQCHTEDSRTLTTGDIVCGAFNVVKMIKQQGDKASAADKAVLAKLRETLKKYDLPEEKLEEICDMAAQFAKMKQHEQAKGWKKALAPIKDQLAFFVDVSAAVAEWRDPFAPPPPKGTPPEILLKDVKIDGDTAVGKLTYKDGQPAAPVNLVRFRKEEGSWRMQLPEPEDFFTTPSAITPPSKSSPIHSGTGHPATGK